jgi:hypothetical protein
MCTLCQSMANSLYVFGIWFDSLICFLSIGMVILVYKRRYLILSDRIGYSMPEDGEP